MCAKWLALDSFFWTWIWTLTLTEQNLMQQNYIAFLQERDNCFEELGQVDSSKRLEPGSSRDIDE